MFTQPHLRNRVTHELRVLVAVVQETQACDRGVAMNLEGNGFQIGQAVEKEDRILLIELVRVFIDYEILCRTVVLNIFSHCCLPFFHLVKSLDS